MRSKWDELEALKAYLAELVRAPETCPAFKIGMTWSATGSSRATSCGGTSPDWRPSYDPPAAIGRRPAVG
jgi:hypothetical protein